MSRIGKKAILIPAGTTASVADSIFTVKGKGGTLSRAIHPTVSVAVNGNEINVTPSGKTRLGKALWGTYTSHIRNMVDGVNTAFVKKLEVQGIGYKAEMLGKQIKLSIGFSHPVLVDVPEGITVLIEKNIVTLTGIDKDAVGQFAANIRSLKKPEPYKGKGIRYQGEVVNQKQGKKSAS